MAQTISGRYRFWEQERPVLKTTAERRKAQSRASKRHAAKRSAKGLCPTSTLVYQRRLALGQCPRCGRPQRANYVSCAKCAAKYAKAQGLKPKTTRAHRESANFPFHLQVGIPEWMRIWLVETAAVEQRSVASLVRGIIHSYHTDVEESAA